VQLDTSYLAAPELSFGKKCLQFKNRQFWLFIKGSFVSKQWLSVLLSVNLYFALDAPSSHGQLQLFV